MSKKRKENVLVVDGFEIERASMKALLATEKRIGEVYEASDLEEVKEAMASNHFALIICSLISLNEEGILLLTNMKRLSGEQPIIVLGPDNKQDHIQTVMRLGADGYVTKNENWEVVLEGVRNLLEGEAFFPGLDGKEGKQEALKKKTEKPTISDREKEILRLVITGMNNVRIGEELNISVRTVENHRANMMRKLHVKNTAELVKTAITQHLVDF